MLYGYVLLALRVYRLIPQRKEMKTVKVRLGRGLTSFSFCLAVCPASLPVCLVSACFLLLETRTVDSDTPRGFWGWWVRAGLLLEIP